MKINIEILKKHDVCKKGLNWFINHYGETSIDVYKVIKQLEEEKDSNYWIYWLFKKFKLTGSSKSWYSNGELMYEYNFVNGKLHGICIGFDDIGGIIYKHNYKDGRLI